MPEMHFVVRWPDGKEEQCYSPSLIVRDYLEVGSSYSIGEFLRRSRAMLNIASERGRSQQPPSSSPALRGRSQRAPSSSPALEQLDELERRGAAYHPDSRVTVVAFRTPELPV